MKLRASTVVIILLIGLGASRPTMATELEFNAVEQNTLQVLLNYIRSGADLNAMHDGSSLLHCCAVKSRNRLARELVAGGIDVLLVDADGKRADQLTSGRGLTHNFFAG